MKRMAAGNKVKQGEQRREPSKEQSRKNSEQREGGRMLGEGAKSSFVDIFST